MPVSLARRGAWIAGIVVVLAVLFVVALPLVASTQIVRDGIAYQMSAWSGYRVRLDDRPNIRVWPFRAVLNDVTFLDWDQTDPRPVLEAERIELDLSALAALTGNIVFTRMQLIRPVLRLTEDGGSMHLPPPESWGRLAQSVGEARAVVSKAAEAPKPSALPGDAFGEVTFVDARVTTSMGENHRDIVTSLTGELDWPALNRQATLSAKGIWHGESIVLEAVSQQPLVLLGGGSAPISFSLQAAPANASFNGVASFAGNGFIDGQFTFSAPSLNRFVEWTHSVVLPGSRIGPITVAARVTGDAQRMKLEQATLGLAGSTGKGLLDVSLAPGRPSIVGTLALDTLKLDALMQTFSPFSSGQPPAHAAVDARGYDVDLRFSAASASFAGAALTNLAAAIKVKDGLTTFDISDATAFGGTVQAGMRADRTAAGEAVEIRMTGENVDAGRAAATLGMQRFVPQAPSTFSVMLRGTGESLDTVLATAEGTASVTFGKGSIPGLNLDAFLQRGETGDFFPLSALGESALPIDGAEIKAAFSKGLVRIEKAEARSGQHRFSVDGLAPIAGRGLALYGTLMAAEGADPRLKSPLVFFVGGSWNAPFIASFLPPARGEGAGE